MRAKDYFEDLLLVEGSLRRAREALELARSKLDGVGSQSFGGGPHGTRQSPDSATLGRIAAVDESKRRLVERIEELAARESEALRVIESVRPENARTANVWRDCLSQRYVRGWKVSDIADALDMSASGVRFAIDSALDWIDAAGGPEVLAEVS